MTVVSSTRTTARVAKIEASAGKSISKTGAPIKEETHEPESRVRDASKSDA